MFDNRKTETPDLESRVQDMLQAATDLLARVRAAREAETAQRRAWNQEHVQPWTQEFEAARQSLLDYAASHRRDLADAAALVADNKTHLVNLEVVRGLGDRYHAAEALLAQAPEPPVGIWGILRSMRRGSHRLDQVDGLVDTLLGAEPARAHTAASEAAARWRDDLRELPPECYVTVAGGRRLIFDHEVLAQRMEAEPVPVA